MGIREYRRTPVLLALLIAIPVYVIGVFQVVIPETELKLQLASGTTITATAGNLIGILMTPAAGALIGGITGLFVMQMTRGTDERLVVAGYRPHQVVLARLGLLGIVGILVTVVSTTTLFLTGFVPESVGWFVLATLLATLIYGLIGILVGSVLDTLAGVYLLLFAPMIDLFLFQNPLATKISTFSTYLPGHFPMRLAMDAAFTESIDVEVVVWSLVVLAVLSGVAIAAFYHSMHTT
jgi:ABC-2 type transport system permease protein